ncbi:hypothetical protein PI124_g1896 [Phytophthora idaei]|nr:hypothetical protein PI125_g5898 [Phytophthora idaei]KAG3172724.1 hypothetical protein PI126_g1199 [Phytophthora idaei]KAG3253509.1 hypothetical protein PI124_g1896 [Phytophthora idaei]
MLLAGYDWNLLALSNSTVTLINMNNSQYASEGFIATLIFFPSIWDFYRLLL